MTAERHRLSLSFLSREMAEDRHSLLSLANPDNLACRTV